MGPLLALVELAKRRGLSPFLGDVVATKKKPLFAVDLEADGGAALRELPEGYRTLGHRNWQRTGGARRPRAFCDDATYTLKKGLHRDAYADLVEAMVRRHPKAAGLRALLAFLRGQPPKHKKIKDARYIPMYRGRPVVNAVVSDYEDVEEDPYEPPSDLPRRPDVITGRWCRPSTRKPIRILGFGAVSGTTFLSVDDPVTISHPWKKQPALARPMAETTMHLSVAGLQSLIDERNDGRPAWLSAQRGSEDKLGYFVWTDEDTGSAVMVQNVLRGRARIGDVEAWATSHKESRENLCVLGVHGSKRLAIYGWSHQPLCEAVEHVLAYARATVRAGGSVPGVRDLCKLAFPSHSLPTTQDMVQALIDGLTGWPTFAAVVDHIIEGHAFPALLRQRVETALAIAEPDGSFHQQHQHNLVSSDSMKTIFDPAKDFPFDRERASTMQICGIVYAIVHYEGLLSSSFKSRPQTQALRRQFVAYPDLTLPQIYDLHHDYSEKIRSRNHMAQLETLFEEWYLALDKTKVPKVTSSMEKNELQDAVTAAMRHFSERWQQSRTEEDTDPTPPAAEVFDPKLDDEQENDPAEVEYVA